MSNKTWEKNKGIIKSHNGKKTIWLSKNVAQAIVLVNGLIITIAAFLIFNYFIKEMSVENYKRVSQESGKALVDGISGVESTMRLVSGLILLSENKNKDDLVYQIRRSVPNLSTFDQLIWIYEETPGAWQYKFLYERPPEEFEKKKIYWLTPDSNFIRRLVTEGYFQSEKIRVVSDFKGMEYKNLDPAGEVIGRSFSLIKAPKENNSKKGIVIGVTRATLLFDQGIVSKENLVSRMTIRDVLSGRRIHHMNREKGGGESVSRQEYGFFVGDTEWQIVLEFLKADNVKLLEYIPYVILLFGSVLTVLGTLFIRNN